MDCRTACRERRAETESATFSINADGLGGGQFRPPVNLLLTGASFPNFSCSAGDYTKLSLLPQILSDAPLGPSITIGRLTAIFLLGCRLGALNSENYDPNWRSPLVFLPRSSGRVS